MPRTCPWCCEPLAWRQRQAATCPHCTRPLRVADGAQLRPVDLRLDEVVAFQRERYHQMLRVGLPVVAVVALVMPLLHLAAAGLAPVLMVAHLVVVRLFLIGRGRRLVGTARRLFTRWITRLSFLWVGLPGYGLAAVPVAGVVVGMATFAGLTALAHHYTVWGLRREKERLPLTSWEKAVLLVLAALTAALVVLLLVLALVVGTAVWWLAERLG